jgi:hypothetical protein
MPADMRDCVDLVPEKAGILLAHESGRVETVRTAKMNPGSRKLTDAEVLHVGRIAATRIWKMKREMLEKEAAK